MSTESDNSVFEVAKVNKKTNIIENIEVVDNTFLEKYDEDLYFLYRLPDLSEVSFPPGTQLIINWPRINEEWLGFENYGAVIFEGDELDQQFDELIR